ncbi:MAG: O-antigen ligase family protein, partial [Lachnospiraceae bacterium]
VYEKGFRYYGKKWNYQAHNVYFQLLGETGIVGFSIYTSMLVLLMKKIVYVTCKKKMHWNVTILYWSILYVIYSFTGNTFYYPGQVIILFICITAYSNRVVFE